MSSSLDKLKAKTDFNLAVATVYSGKELVVQKIDGVTYYLVPLSGKSISKYNKSLESAWKLVKAEFKPDVIHIHGTEFPHGLAWIRSCGADRCVISIQGLVSVISRYYNVEDEKIARTIRDIV